MAYLLLILPALAHILMGAHLLFHGLGLLVASLPLVAILLLFIPRHWAAKFQSLLLALWGIEWLRAAVVLANDRMEMGMPWMRAAAIMAGCAIFSWLVILVFRQARLKWFYCRKI